MNRFFAVYRNLVRLFALILLAVILCFALRRLFADGLDGAMRVLFC